MLIGMLFNPLRQIADKFNEMQMGMIAANRVFAILDIQDQVQENGMLKLPILKENYLFKMFVLVILKRRSNQRN
jgi:ATP-binding cassette, subfamily B, multidrug efflux pump